MSPVPIDRLHREGDPLTTGAEVQNHLIREVDLAHKKSNSFHNGLRQHHTDRIKLASDWVRYPNVLVSSLITKGRDELMPGLPSCYRQL